MNAKVQENNTKILNLLQEAVDAEKTSSNLYWARSVFWRSVGLFRLADYYLAQSQEDHAQRSADRMAFLGRQPVVVAGGIDANDEPDLAEQFRVDLQIEILLANQYANNIKVAEEEGDYVTRQVWLEVMTGTQEHVAWLQKQLKLIDMMGSDNYLSTWHSDKDILL